MQTLEIVPPSLSYVTNEWKPDLARFQRELASARETGMGDPLTLAEMECSLDLLDADIAALKAAKEDVRTQTSRSEAIKMRRTLSDLIEALRPLCADN